MGNDKRPRLDKVIHERARLVILTYLASSEKRETSFTELKDILGFTPGNLSVQLKNLDEAGYVTIRKTFKDNKPFTSVEITAKGSKALQDYLQEMEAIITHMKKRKNA